jgi:hypothetical protein
VFSPRSNLLRHCGNLSNLRVDEITTEHVLATLKGRSKGTAHRVRGDIYRVLGAAQALGHIPDNVRNAAQWRGGLDQLMAKPPAAKHHEAMPYIEVRVPRTAARAQAGCRWQAVRRRLCARIHDPLRRALQGGPARYAGRDRHRRQAVVAHRPADEGGQAALRSVVGRRARDPRRDARAAHARDR